jgi:LysM repeat protein
MIYRSVLPILLALLVPAAARAQSTNAPASAMPAPSATATTGATEPTPAVNAPSAVPDASAPRPATYTLQAGDTLEKVGQQWGLTGRALQKYNHLTNKQVRRLQIGTVIKVPPAKVEKTESK